MLESFNNDKDQAIANLRYKQKELEKANAAVSKKVIIKQQIAESKAAAI